MHKMESSQAYCKDFLKRNPKKFILYFSKVPTNFYLISKFGSISVNWIIQKILEKKNRAVGPAFGPHPTAPLGQQPVMAAREPDVWACRRGHRCAVTVAAADAGTDARSPWLRPAQGHGRHRLTVGRGVARCVG
jgi:hypothetical protein